MLGIRRRDFIVYLGTAALWPRASRAQQRPMPLLGILHPNPANLNSSGVVAIRKGLAEVGYIEGRNLIIEYRWAEDQYDRLPALAADLVRRQVSAIVTAGGNPANLVAKAATASIPIVFTSSDDPVKLGLVASLNRPGGNITGVAAFVDELTAKRVELLHELVPTAKVIGMLVSPSMSVSQTQEAQRAAAKLGLQMQVLRVKTSEHIAAAFASLKQRGVEALILAGGGFFMTRSDQIIALAAHSAIPVSYYRREFVADGGLFSYGANVSDNYRLAGVYAGRILNGEKPADLPVLQPTRFELVLNLKTARALGLTVPPTLFAITEEVIE